MICVHEEKQSKFGRTVSVGAGMTGRRSPLGGQAKLPEKDLWKYQKKISKSS